MKNLHNNRLHTLTRWPSDYQRCQDLAVIDVDFCYVLRKIGVSESELNNLHRAAVRMLMEVANFKNNGNGCGGRGDGGCKGK